MRTLLAYIAAFSTTLFFALLFKHFFGTNWDYCNGFISCGIYYALLRHLLLLETRLSNK